MNSDQYDSVLSDIALIKELLFRLSKVLNSIENDVKLLLMMYSDTKSANAKDDKIPMRKLVDTLPNDLLLDEFEHTEGTYKDYSRMTYDNLTEDEIKSFEAGLKGEVYEPEPLCKCPKHITSSEITHAVDKAIAERKQQEAYRKANLSAVDSWPTDEELDQIEAAELKAYKDKLTDVL